MLAAARRCGEDGGDAKLVLQAGTNMSLIHAALKQWDEAVLGFQQGLAAAEQSNDLRLVSLLANNLSVVLWERDGATDEALAMARRALETKLPIRDWVSIAQTANSIVGLHCDRHEYEAAHEALAAAAAWVEQANAISPRFYFQLNRAKLLATLDNPQRDDEAAFVAFAEAIRIAHDGNMVEPEARAHEQLARAHAARGEHAQAYTHLDHYNRLQEKYLTEDAAQRLEKLRHAADIERLERERLAERTRRETVEALNARLERTGRERDSLLRLVGHDLRTHVGGMMGLGELIRASLPLGSDDRENADDLCSLGESTLALLQEIMEHGSALDGAFAEQHCFDLVASLRDVKRRLDPLFAAKGQPFDLQVPAEPVFIRSNRSGLGRIVENLLTNAAKFSPPGAATSLRLAASLSGWQIAVIDHGQGIPGAERPRLFQANQRLSVRPTGNESSTGLGLLLIHDIALMIGATLAHEPTPGGGATFVVGFPPGCGEAAPSATPAPNVP